MADHAKSLNGSFSFSDPSCTCAFELGRGHTARGVMGLMADSADQMQIDLSMARLHFIDRAKPAVHANQYGKIIIYSVASCLWVSIHHI